jgi:hypothetical protein
MYSCVESSTTVVKGERQGEGEDREEEEKGGGEEDTKAKSLGEKGEKKTTPVPKGKGTRSRGRPQKKILARRKAIASGPRPLRFPIFIQPYASYP